LAGRTLEELTVSGDLLKAKAALDLLKLAEEHYEGDALKWMLLICLDVIEEAIDSAKVAFAKVVGNQKVVAA